MGNKIIFLNAPTLECLRTIILENEFMDSLAVDMKLFDELALDYRNNYAEPIKEPFIFLGVWIRMDNTSLPGSGIAILRGPNYY